MIFRLCDILGGQLIFINDSRVVHPGFNDSRLLSCPDNYHPVKIHNHTVELRK